jgi:toxin-antitoxin system PIN domain toxin
VIVVDACILLYAYDSRSIHHATARSWVEEVLSGTTIVGFPWQTVAAFLRIATNTKLPGDRFTSSEAIEIVENWAARWNVRLLGPGDQHWTFFRRAIEEGQANGPLVTDAQLAAITIESGGVLYTTDRDFARFPGLRWKNPLI